MGDSVISCGQIAQKSALKWRGPAVTLDIDEASRVAMKFQNQAFKLARFCVRKRRKPGIAGDVYGMDAAHSPHDAPGGAAMDVPSEVSLLPTDAPPLPPFPPAPEPLRLWRRRQPLPPLPRGKPDVEPRQYSLGLRQFNL